MNKNIKAKLIQRLSETYKQTVEILKKNGKCVILRPSGFGKTVTMCRIAQREEYKKVLYIYPTKIIKEQALKYLKGDKAKIEWVTYYKFGKYHKNPEII